MQKDLFKRNTIGLSLVVCLALASTGCHTSRPSAAAASGPQLQRTHATSWALQRGSVVSPYGDAPAERDLELTANW